ncbi:MAG TPA: copper resistance protein CopC [Acidobacteriaceae bacterium]
MKLLLFLIAALALSAGAARAQGCAQCRDDVRAAPLPVQQAYRHAIELLAISGLGVFAGGVLVLRRYR